MTVGELKKAISTVDDDLKVSICVNTPGGYVCPDGAVVDVKYVMRGIDWHGWELLIVPLNKLDIHDVGKWSKRQEDC